MFWPRVTCAGPVFTTDSSGAIVIGAQNETSSSFSSTELSVLCPVPPAILEWLPVSAFGSTWYVTTHGVVVVLAGSVPVTVPPMAAKSAAEYVWLMGPHEPVATPAVTTQS